MFHACAKSLSSSIWSHNANIIVCCAAVYVCVWAAVSTLRHVLFVRDPHKSMSLSVALCHCDFLNPTIYSWFIPGLYLLSLWQKPPKKYGVITPKLKEVDNADNSFRFKYYTAFVPAIKTHPDAKHRHTFINKKQEIRTSQHCKHNIWDQFRSSSSKSTCGIMLIIQKKIKFLPYFV